MARNLDWKDKDLEDYQVLVDYVNAQYAFLTPKSQQKLLRKHFRLAEEEPNSSHNFHTAYITAPVERIIGRNTLIGKTDEKRYQEYLTLVGKNHFYRWLHADSDFNVAYRLFKRKQSARQPNNYQKTWSELRFHKVAALVGRFIILNRNSYRPKDPTARQVSQAITRAEGLRRSMQAGVGFRSKEETARFIEKLDQLIAKLMSDKKRRYKKPHADANRIGRDFVADASRQLLIEFDEASPVIVTNLARMVGYEADETAIQRQITRARKEHAKQD